MDPSNALLRRIIAISRLRNVIPNQLYCHLLPYFEGDSFWIDGQSHDFFLN
jgi:hypothetical protein